MNKGMPIWEQHIEKLVLGLVVILLMAVFALIVLDLDPISAEVSGRSYSPAELGDVMVERSQELGRKLGPNSSADTSQFEAIVVDGGQGFAAALDRRLGPDEVPPRIAAKLASSLLPEEIGSVDVWYHEPEFAAPVMGATVMQNINTLDSQEFNRVPELNELKESSDVILAGSDADVVWTTPVATINLRGVRRELAETSKRSDPPRNQIPSNWYNERPYVIDVVFERQTMDERSGTWGPIERVEAFPGAFSLRQLVADQTAANELDADFRFDVWFNLDDKVKQMEILQPDFFATVNDSDSDPTMAATTYEDAVEEGLDEEEDERQRRVNELNRRIKVKNQEIRRITGTLNELGGPLEEEEANAGSGSGSGSSGRGRDRDTGGGGFGGSGSGMGAGGAGRKSGGSSAVGEADKKRRVKLTGRLRQLEKQLEDLQKDLAEVDPEANLSDMTDSGPEIEVMDLQASDEAMVWCHDLRVEQGKTYRYRVRIDFFNPFFGRGSLLLKEQAKLADVFTITSETSEWSAPVTIYPPVEFFVVRATDNTGSLGLGQARVEMYRYVNGKRVSETFTIQPGEPIGGTETIDGQKVDFSSGWYLVDVVDDPAAMDGALDREDNARVVCRRLDGRTVELLVPSEELRQPSRSRLKYDADSAASSS